LKEAALRKRRIKDVTDCLSGRKYISGGSVSIEKATFCTLCTPGLPDSSWHNMPKNEMMDQKYSEEMIRLKNEHFVHYVRQGCQIRLGTTYQKRK
jgi:hypothetical protein